MKWLLGTLLLLVVAVALGMELLIYTAYVLLAMLVVSRALARRWIEGLAAERECSRLSAQVGDKVAVAVTVINKGRLPVPWVLAEDVLPWQAIVERPPRIKVTGPRRLIAMLRPGGRKTMFYQLHFQMRGYIQAGPLLLESGDLFGLHRRYRVATDPHYVLVYPRVVPLAGYDLASRRPIGEIRLASRLYEDPTRISGVRDYQPGDALNRVHWRATARTGKLHSKTYEPSTIAGATVLLDFHAAAYPNRNEPYRSELAVTTVASLANAVYQMGQQVGLVTNGRDAADRIRIEGWQSEYRDRRLARESVAMRDQSGRLRPLVVDTRRGADQLLRILETLARVELTDGLDFSQLVAETIGRLPRDATVVAVLPDVSPQTAFALSTLKRRGLAVTAVVIAVEDDEWWDASRLLLRERIDFRRIAREEDLAVLGRADLVG